MRIRIGPSTIHVLLMMHGIVKVPAPKHAAISPRIEPSILPGRILMVLLTFKAKDDAAPLTYDPNDLVALEFYWNLFRFSFEPSMSGASHFYSGVLCSTTSKLWFCIRAGVLLML